MSEIRFIMPLTDNSTETKIVSETQYLLLQISIEKQLVKSDD